MEKLLELLREYSTLIGERTGEYGNPIRGWNEVYLTYPIEIMRIKSKEYGFIERLVEQNKIDDSKVGNSDMLSVQYHDLVNDYKYEGLIMILSISENPISDLCYFLKE